MIWSVIHRQKAQVVCEDGTASGGGLQLLFVSVVKVCECRDTKNSAYLRATALERR